MISFCIPIFNRCVLPLCNTLMAQAEEAKVEVELVCIDDCSSDEYRLQNAPLSTLGKYIQLPENIGRSRIRNRFLQYATGRYLLFLDNDMEVPQGFVGRYAEVLKQEPAVVVGGVAYHRRRNDPQHALRYMYGTQVESRSAAERSQHPYRSFMTGNFLVRRDVLERYPFDESLSTYGHEDTLFGYALQCHQVHILHIGNPAFNTGVETNAEFLDKTRCAVGNLSVLYHRMQDDELFCRSVRLIRTYQLLKERHLLDAVHLIYRLLRCPLVSHFEAGNAISVKQFNYYKLGLFIEQVKNIS